MKWLNTDIKLLKELYSTYKNEELLEKFNRSIKSITMKANHLGLKKTIEHKSLLQIKRNKLRTRDLTFEYLQELALKYKTRGDFQNADSSAYTVSRIRGWLNIICEHMIPQKYSTPQLILNLIIKNLVGETLYNDRKVIKPLEIDVYVPSYKLGFEYDGKAWHKNKSNTLKIKKCHDENIKLFILIENNRNYEDDIKNQLCLILDEINILCNKNITKKQIINFKVDYNLLLLDYRNIKIICDKYIDYNLFIKEQPKIYNKLIKLKLIDKYTSHMYRNRISWTIDLLKNEILLYDTLNDFIKKSNDAYQYMHKNKLDFLIKHLKRRRVLNYDICIEYIKKNKPINKFMLRKNDNGIYQYLKKHINVKELQILIDNSK